MAKKYGARSASRQSNSDAPEPAATAPTRTTRAARLQSREPEPLEMLPSTAGTDQEQPTRKRGGRQAKQAIELPTLEEDADADADEAQPDGEQQAEVSGADDRRVSMAPSVLSGTTAKTSFSQEEISDLDPDNMIDLLPDLSRAAERLATFILPSDSAARPQHWKQIRTAGSRQHKLFENRVASLNALKPHFGSGEYIDLGIVLRALMGAQNVHEVPTGTWRPDGVLRKINLAEMLCSIVISAADPHVNLGTTHDAVERLFVAFDGAIADTDSGFQQKDFDMCLAILVQRAVVRLSVFVEDRNFQPRETVVNTFFESEEDGNLSLRYSPYHDLPEEEQHEHVAVLQDIMKDLLGVFDDSDRSTWGAGIKELQNRYPFASFIDQAVQYYDESVPELEDQIRGAGGIDAIVIGLAEQVSERATERELLQKRQSLTQPGEKHRQSFGRSAAQLLKERAKQNKMKTASVSATAPAAAPVATIAPPTAQVSEQRAVQLDNNWYGLPEDDEEDNAQPPTKATQSTAISALSNLQNKQQQYQQQQAAKRGQKRSFTDRQEGAHRVEWDENEATQFRYPASSTATQGPYYNNPAPQPLEHGEPAPFEPTQDDGFEVDTRDNSAADARRAQVAAQQPQSRPLPRFSDFAGRQSTAPAPTPLSPNKRQRKNPGASMPAAVLIPGPDSTAPLDPATRTQRARIEARQSTMMRKPSKGPQQRSPWTDDEEAALIDLIESEVCDTGIQWATLKGLDTTGEQRLERRSAEDFRFKARNLKLMFLKGSPELPKNFEHIMLDQKAKVQLRDMGIDYEQAPRRAGARTKD